MSLTFKIKQNILSYTDKEAHFLSKPRICLILNCFQFKFMFAVSSTVLWQLSWSLNVNTLLRSLRGYENEKTHEKSLEKNVSQQEAVDPPAASKSTRCRSSEKEKTRAEQESNGRSREQMETTKDFYVLKSCWVSGGLKSFCPERHARSFENSSKTLSPHVNVQLHRSCLLVQNPSKTKWNSFKYSFVPTAIKFLKFYLNFK